MDIKRVTSNQSSVIKSPKKTGKFFDFKKLKINSKLKIQNSKLKKIKDIFNTKKKKLSFSLLFILLLVLPAYFIFFHNKAGASWWNSDWHYRRSITINSSQIPGDLTNYPMLVSFTDSNLINKAQTDGDDIIFVESNGNKLNHEIEKFNNTTGELVAWVKIPELDGDNDSIIYMYYGNQIADNQQRPEDVWDENFKMVQHLEEGGTGTRYDSTRSNKDGTPSSYEGTESTNGKIGGADDFDTTNSIDLGTNIFSNADLASGSVSTWVKADTLGTSTKIAFNIENRIAFNWSDYLTVPTYNFRSYIYDGSHAVSTSTLNTGEFAYFVMTWDGVNMRLYKNGVLVDTDAIGSPDLDAVSGVNRIGSDNNSSTRWDGIIDEVRISNSARTANWITTEYNNQNSPSTFISLGQEELGPSPALYLPFDEGFGTTAHDETSNHNDGTIVGATWKDESMCKNGKCLEFDGNGDYVEINDNQSLDLDKEVTLEAWIKPTTTDKKNQTILSKEETPTDPTKIYRSVGPSATSAITTGATNSLNITGDKATFQTALPDNIGVGDVIQYDDDDDGDIDSSDSLAFIVERITSYEYRITNASGTTPTPINSDNNWSIFRAYTSLANAEAGIENTGIDSDLRNFDDWTAGGDATTDDVGKDLVAANQQWNIACYANGTTADGRVGFAGWTTNNNNLINIYTPVNSSEVGVSQRHTGRWDTNKYYISYLGGNNLTYFIVNNLIIDGIQFNNGGSAGTVSALEFGGSSSGNIIVRNNIMKSDRTSPIHAIYIANVDPSPNFNIYNNIIYKFGINGIYDHRLSSSKVNIFNNTIYDVGQYGIYTRSIPLLLKNNVVNNCASACYLAYTGFAFNSASLNNITNQAPDVNSAFGTTYTTGTTNGTTASKLINSTETFITKKIQIGSIIKNTTDTTYTYVTAIDSETQLSVANDIFVSGEGYTIYTNKYGTASFVSTTAGSEDFHLNPTDTVAKNSGADLSQDNVFPFATDIDGQSRFTLNTKYQIQDTAWDIGADEAQATQIYRSVSPNKTDALEAGDDNSLTIVGNTATFQRALADNVGVGDVIQYDDDNDGDIDANDSLAFIVERISNYEYRITNASGGVPTQIINDKDWSIFRAYTSLANAENGDENTGIDSDLRNFDTWTGGKDLVTSKEQWNIACYANGTTPDTTAVTVDGWTTGIQNFVRIYTPKKESEVGITQRHSGRWDDSKYYLLANAIIIIRISDSYTKLDGMQCEGTSNSYGGYYIYIDEASNAIIGSNIIRVTKAYRSHAGIGMTNSSRDIKVINNIIYGFANGGISSSAEYQKTNYIYNNTISSSGTHGIAASNNYIIAKNNLVHNCTTAYYLGSGVFIAGSDYNASDDGSSAGGAHDKINQTFSFVNEAGGDYHLSPTDTVARNAGSNLSNDPYLPFNTDIEGEKRETYDIGADEATATKIYRSVGPNNTTALATDESHENTVSLTNGISTFEKELPDRVGVGDAVLIDTNNDNSITSADTLLFIHGRTSSTVYTLRTHTGSVPGDISVNDTYQIFRAYTSLANAEAGTKNTSIPVSFNGGNRDLVTNNEQWNIACYGDSVDTTAVRVDGWTTGVENYIKFYAPENSSEVGISQRHEGKWDTGKYAIEVQNAEPFRLEDDYIKVDGLQIRTNSVSVAGVNVVLISYLNSNNDIQITNSIIRGANNPSFWQWGLAVDDSDANLKIYNVILYDINSGDANGVLIRISDVNRAYIYNSTLIGGNIGLRNVSGTTYAKNVISRSNLSADFLESGGTLYCNNCASEDGTADDQNGDGVSGNNKVNQTFTFRDAPNKDFRLAMNDTAAKGAGINLSNDLNLPISSDIEGELRPNLRDLSTSLLSAQDDNTKAWDIGADQISATTHNNYSLNLNTNYPQVSYSIGFDGTDEAMPRLYEENFSSGDSDLNPNEWSHIAYKRSNDREEIYINGSKKDSKTISNFLKTNNGKLYIGSKNTSSKDSFKGFLDEIKIYPYARTEAEIKKDKVQGSSGRASSRATEGTSVSIGDTSTSLNDGLVGYWKMDETTGTIVADSSGNNNNGTLTNAQETGTSDASGNTTTNMLDTDGTLATTDDAYNGMTLRFTAACGSITSGTERTISDYTGASKTFIVSIALASVPNSCAYEIDHQVGGKFGGGVGFDGGNDYTIVPAPAGGQLDFTGDFSVSFWVNPTSIVTSAGFVGKHYANSYYVSKSNVGSNSAITFAIDNDNSVTGGVLEVGKWNLVTATYDLENQTAIIYKDGVEVARGSNIGPPEGDSSNDLKFGASGNLSTFHNGKMDEIRLYKKTLSPNEIKQLYNYAPGPIAHWKLDEKSGTTAFDSSGGNNHGALNGGPIWENGKFGSALKFDGSDYVRTGNLSNNGDFTVSAWSFAVDNALYNDLGIISTRTYSSSQGFTMRYRDFGTTDRLEVAMGDSPTTYAPITNNQCYMKWCHFSFTYNYSSGISNVYINGNFISTIAFAPNVIVNQAVNIGQSIDINSAWFKGLIDDVKIYNYARTQEQILEDMGAQSSSISGGSGALKKPILDLSFSEGQGSTAYDSSGNNNNGTLVSGTTGGNTTTTAMWDKGGKKGGAMEFDGTNDYVTIADSPSLSSGAYTLSAWLNFNAYGTSDTILGKGAETWITYNNRESYSGGCTYDRISFTAQNGTTNKCVSSIAQPPLHTWVHVVGVHTGSEIKLYIDGVLNDSISQGPTSNGSYTFDIGSYSGAASTYAYNGLVDEIKFYPYALSDDEIKTLYNDSSAMVMGNDESRNNNGAEVTGGSKDYCIPGDTAKCDKPVLELKMDEMTGTTAKDTSGNGNNGTISGATWDPLGKIGSALRLDGSDDYIRTLTSPLPSVPTSGFTGSIWANLDRNNEGYIWELGGSDSFDLNWSESSPGSLYCMIRDLVPNYYSTPPVVVANSGWHYFSCVLDQNTDYLNLYVDGILRSSVSVPVFNGFFVNGPFNVGARGSYGGISASGGLVDDLKIYNYARTPAQIAWDYNRGKEINHWAFDEGTGSIAHDLGDNKNNGTITGATWKNENECKNGKCLYFDGEDLTRVDMDTQDNMANFSACAWINPKAWTNPDSEERMIVFSKGWELVLTNEGKISFSRYTSSAYPVITTTDSIDINAWSRVCGIYKGVATIPEVYINGEMGGSGFSGSGTEIDESAYTLRIGATRANEYAYNFYGYIDEPKIYNYALTAEQVKQDYNGGAVSFE